MSLTTEQAAAQVILEVANNKPLSGAVATADMDLWRLCLRGVNSPKVRPEIEALAERVRVIAREAGVVPVADSLATW